MATLQPGQAVFIHGCLGGVGRSAAQIAALRGAFVAGSCRPSAAHDAAELGIAPIVDFDFDPAPLAGRFEIVFDTAGTLPITAARKMVRPGGRIIDLTPTPAKLARAVLPGPYTVLIAKANPEDLEEIARAAGRGALRLPIARRVPLTDGIRALTELETEHIPRGGKVVITID
jgi:NADPH:quinone reductase-like Zn-dependent oxidoreductase